MCRVSVNPDPKLRSSLNGVISTVLEDQLAIDLVQRQVVPMITGVLPLALLGSAAAFVHQAGQTTPKTIVNGKEVLVDLAENNGILCTRFF